MGIWFRDAGWSGSPDILHSIDQGTSHRVAYMISKDQLVVVIRSVGERTEQLCKSLMTKAIDENQIHVIREVPFEESLRESFRIGQKSGSKWLLVVDADLLILPHSVGEILQEAEEQPSSVFHIQGFIYDKLFVEYRKAGPRIFRTRDLGRAIELIPDDGTEHRPESHTIQRMQSEGYVSVSSDLLFGVHDFEQFYRDVYRKCVVHAFKHKSDIDKLIHKWILNIDDNDYQIALAACLDAYTRYETVSIDKRLFEENGRLMLERVGLAEKSGNVDLDEIESEIFRILKAAGPIPNHLKTQITTEPDSTRATFVSNLFKGRGVFSATRYLIGQGIVKIGTIIRGKSD
jgi:hypothetical protein